MHHSIVSSFRDARTRILVVLSLAAFTAATTASQPTGNSAANRWTCARVRHIAGLPDVKADASGTLSMTARGLTFSSSRGSFTVERDKLVWVSLGDERVLQGGHAARLLRTGITLGGGTAVAAAGVSQGLTAIPALAELLVSLATQGDVDILTVEFLDARGAYHGAVFTLPRRAANGIGDMLPPLPSPPAAQATAQGCASLSPERAGSLVLEPVGSDVAQLPAEYRVLLYERTFDRLRTALPNLRVFRFGDPQANCAAARLKITVTGFSKGDAAQRAIAGPAGWFVGVSRVACRVALTDAAGQPLLSVETKAAERGDRESLDVTKLVARALRRRILKARTMWFPGA